MVQDDVVFSRNVKDYLDRLPIPLRASCLKLYASGVVEPDLPLHYGFHAVPQITSSCDAQAIMFTREQAMSLLMDQKFLDHQFCDRGYANIDGAIFKSSVARGRTQYIHRPSLCQHIGVTSSLDHEWRHESMSQCFYGEEFDCDSLSDIAVVGYDTYSGLGYLSRDASANLRCHWCAPEHPRFVNRQKTWPCDFNSKPPKDLVDFLRTFKTVLCFENPYWRQLPELIGNCVLVPMYEWFPPTGWEGVKHYICPTRQCYEFVKSCGHSCSHLKWPIDTNRFPFRQRDVCERFVFCHGTGGHSDRKGALILSEAAKMVPHIPLTVFTQTKTIRSGNAKAVAWPRHVAVRDQVRDPNEIYNAGDVLLYPSRFEGLGLPQLEAMSTGMPVISSDVPPVNEHHAWLRVPSIVVP